MKYEGHTVIKAEKTRRNGKEVYRLQVDRDSMDKDYGFALLFDMQWKQVGAEKVQAPPPPKPPEPPTDQPVSNNVSEPSNGHEENNDEKPDEEPADEPSDEEPIEGEDKPRADRTP